MRNLGRLLLAAGLCGLLASTAEADVQDYCAAYARDVANSRVSGGEILHGKIAGTTPETSPKWGAVNSQALNGCLAQYGAEPGETVTTAAAVKTAVKKAPSKPRPAVKTAALVPRSEAWYNYCDKKYASFDRKTGMYRSMKGLMRPCKVPRR